MLRLAIITVWALMITTDSSVSGYAITGRSRDYTKGYTSTSGTTSGFVGLSKESHADLTDQLSSSSAYIPSNSQRYSTVGGSSHSSPGASYSSAAYSDSAQSNEYAGHSSNTPDALNSITSSYTSDAHTASDSSPPGYSTGSSNSDGYSSSSGHGSAGFAGYAGSQSSNAAGLSGSDHASSIEYINSPSSSSYPAPSSSSSASSLTGYVISGPKAAAYTASNHGHPNSQFAPGHSFMMSSGHSSFPSSSHSNSYPGNHLSSYPGNRHSVATYPLGSSHSSHGSYPDGPRFTGPSLGSYLSPHSSVGPSNFIHSSATSPHRGGIPPFLLGASSNVNPSYSKGPGSFYPGPGAFAKSGQKYIIIKENPGNHAALMHPGEPSFPSRMFAGASGFKVKSAGPFTSGPHPGSSNFVSGLHLSSGYPGAGGGHHSGGSPSSYFGYQ